MTPEVIVYTERGWWMKSHQDGGGWWWVRIDSVTGPGENLLRYMQLPSVIETYQPSSMIHELARTSEREGA